MADIYDEYRAVVSHEALLLNAPGETMWLNFGCWSKDAAQQSYPDAARALFEQAFGPLREQLATDRPAVVIDAGCGFGEGFLQAAAEHRRWHFIALNYDGEQLSRLDRLPGRPPNLETLCADAARFTATRPADAVIHVDCAYHFKSRQDFFTRARSALKQGGLLCGVDITFQLPWWLRPFIRLAARLSDIPVVNLVNKTDYQAGLEQAGFKLHAWQDITDCTFEPFFRHVCSRRKEWLNRQHEVAALPFKRRRALYRNLYWAGLLGSLAARRGWLRMNAWTARAC